MKVFSFFLILQLVMEETRGLQLPFTFDPANMIKERGYPAENYTVTTLDGYLLSLYRIPHGRTGTKPNPKPILLNHGLTATCGCFITLNRSLGFVLADNGFDVWLMNSRGNTYANRHTKIPKWNKKLFYDFSFHEVGYYDVPANIDFILNKTNQTKLQYFGHSQGGTVLLILGATRPEYNAKINLATIIGPTYEGRNTHALVKFIAPFANLMKIFADTIGVYDNPLADIERSLLHIVCKSGYFFTLCRTFFDVSGGYAHHEQIDQEIFNNIFRTLPSNVAVKQGIHYLQCVNSERFQQYDYGETKNIVIYGSPKPPKYNMSKITAPISIIVGMQDQLMGLEDAETLRKNLPNVVNFQIVEEDGWNHADFLFARDVIKYVYKNMINVMSLY